MAQASLSFPPPAERKTGRPSILTAELQERICNIIRQGNPAYDAALSCGVSVSAYKVWIQRGKNGEEPFAAFLAATQSAIAEARTKLRGELLVAARADPKNWKAAEAVLQRLEPQKPTATAGGSPIGLPSVAHIDDAAFWAKFERDTLARVQLIEERKRVLAEREREKALLSPSTVAPER
jgi:hypothetical protein